MRSLVILKGIRILELFMLIKVLFTACCINFTVKHAPIILHFSENVLSGELENLFMNYFPQRS